MLLYNAIQSLTIVTAKLKHESKSRQIDVHVLRPTVAIAVLYTNALQIRLEQSIKASFSMEDRSKFGPWVERVEEVMLVCKCHSNL